MKSLILQLSYHLNRTARQAKFWKPTYYEAIPYFVKPHFIDIHDSYQLRSLEEVKAELTGKEFKVSFERLLFKQTDIEAHLKDRKCALIAQMEQFQLSELQFERFKVLVGCRYNSTTKQLKMTCESFPTFQENHTKVNEMFYEIIMESKRAP